MNAPRLSDLNATQSQQANPHPYSRFIKSLRILFPLGVIAIIGVLFLWPQLNHIETAPLTQQDVKALKQAETENRLLKPLFSTLDKNGKPISITAQSARQSKSDENKVFLSQPSAILSSNSDNPLSLSANTGIYDQDEKILTLSDGVEIKDSQNNVLITGDIKANIKDNIAQSVSPATFTTNKAIITGKYVTIDQSNQKTTFHGPAKAVINN